MSRGTIVRAMSPVGIYWSETSHFQNAAYVNAGDLIFTICHFDEDHQPNDFYTDFDDPRAEELRLCAALSLPLGYDAGLMLPFPLHASLEFRQQCVLDDAGILELETKLRVSLMDILDAERRGVIPPLPEYVGGPSYELRADPVPFDLQRQIYSAIDLKDHLVVRGLGAYLRSQMLINGTTFRAEGLYTLFVSLDATFALTLRHLKTSGNNNPTAADAQAFIEDAFGDAPSGMRYFEEFYEDRIKALHPESRFGTFPYPPLSISEGYQLSKALRDVWRYLITGSTIGA